MLSRTKKRQLKPKLLEVATCDIIRCVDGFCYIKIQTVEYERCIINMIATIIFTVGKTILKLNSNALAISASET